MLKVKITWPLLFALLFALIVWLIRAPQPPVTQQTKSYIPRAPRPTRRVPKPARIISNQPAETAGDNGAVSDYDAETARLDREAAEEARATFARHSAANPFKMRQGAWHHDE